MNHNDYQLNRAEVRPTKLTDEVAAKFVAAMARGYLLETAAYLADVSPRTVHTWMAKGRKAHGRGTYGKFYAKVRKAIAECQGSMHDHMVRLSKRDWAALAWLMERRWPKLYGKKEVVRITTGGRTTDEMTMEQLERWVTRVEAAEKAKLAAIESPSSDAV